MHYRVLLGVAAAVGSAFVGACGGGDETRTNTVGPPQPTALEKLEPLRKFLATDYSVKAIPETDLPRREPTIPRKNSAIPDRIAAVEGLTTELPSGGAGRVYTYESADQAQAVAASFLSHADPDAGVQGCGRYVFFSQATGAGPQQWRMAVGRFLTHRKAACQQMFTVVE